MKNQKSLLAGLSSSSFFVLIGSILLYLSSCNNQPEAVSNLRTTSFDDGWHFMKDSLPGAESPDFNDYNWRILDVPHDWSIEDLPGQNGVDIIGPFDKSAIDKGTSAYLVGGTGWYRKHFPIKAEDKDKRAYLQFDGVYMRSDVWVNGKHLGLLLI
jgi:beta-galactosidase